MIKGDSSNQLRFKCSERAIHKTDRQSLALCQRAGVHELHAYLRKNPLPPDAGTTTNKYHNYECSSTALLLNVSVHVLFRSSRVLMEVISWQCMYSLINSIGKNQTITRKDSNYCASTEYSEILTRHVHRQWG